MLVLLFLTRLRVPVAPLLTTPFPIPLFVFIFASVLPRLFRLRGVAYELLPLPASFLFLLVSLLFPFIIRLLPGLLQKIVRTGRVSMVVTYMDS